MAEILEGRKKSHWIWYIFPQLRGLGHSSMSHRYGIVGRAEAEAYLRHPLLGPRLRQITQALLAHAGTDPRDILGDTDAAKVRSCMTLFDAVAPGDIFQQVLDAFYQGQRCSRTLKMLQAEQPNADK